MRGLSPEDFTDRPNVAGLAREQVRNRFIRDSSLLAGYVGLAPVAVFPAVVPASIVALSDITASIGAVRPIVPAAVTATSDVTASVVDVPPPTIAAVIGVTRGLVEEVFTDLASSGGLVDVPQVRKRFIRRAGLDVDFWGEPGASPATGAITPAAITATSDVTATLGARRPVVPAGITATSTITFTLTVRRAVAPAAINASSTVTAGVVAQRAVKPAAITATSTVAAGVTARKAVSATITATSNVTASVSLFGAASPLRERAMAGVGL